MLALCAIVGGAQKTSGRVGEENSRGLRRKLLSFLSTDPQCWSSGLGCP